MFERYTESARRALFFSRYEAGRLGHLSIDTEHLLLGLLRGAKGLCATLFHSAGLTYDAVKARVRERMATAQDVATSDEIPFTADAGRVLEWAAEESNALGHSYIGTEHLLLGLLRAPASGTGTMLAGAGMTLETARSDISRLLGEVRQERTASSDALAHIEELHTVLQELARIVGENRKARAAIELIRDHLWTIESILKAEPRDS